MLKFSRVALLAGIAGTWAATAPAAPLTEQQKGSTATNAVEEVVVTAQKREQAINDIGMAITAVTGADLKDRGVSTTADLTKVVAGLSVVPNGAGITGAPVYTLRGIGFNEKSLGALSAVSFSDDEMPLPYVYTTAGPSLDLQRVEVLKGPQGTLYGQNSTGGAINFISNKPTDTFAAGAELEYGSYNRVDASGYLSGPLTDTLKARLALRSITADGWQNSISRPGDHLGSKDSQAGRLIVDWTPTTTLNFELNVNGWRDRSQSQGTQFLGVNPSVVCAITLPGCPPLSQANYPAFNALYASPVVLPSNASATDWVPGLDYKNDNQFGQIGLRADWDVTSNVKLTSISTASYFRYKTFSEASGTPTFAFNFGADGHVHSYSEELRLAGASFDDRLHWIAGMNFARDTIHDGQQIPSPEVTLFYFLGITNSVAFTNEERSTQAGFASADFDLTPEITLTAGVRYTADQLDFNGCTADPGDGSLSGPLTFGAAAPGTCITFLDETGPDLLTAHPFDSADFGLVRKNLAENNVAWRVGANWKPADGTLLYADVSRGFKGGNFPTLSSPFESAFDAVKQEEVTTYEVGFKTRPFDDVLQLNGAIYYSDYINKQLYVFINDALFGTAETTLNVPKSYVEGAELEAVLRPFSGLTAQANVAYTKTKITEGPACPAPFVASTCVYAAYTYMNFPGGPPNALLDLKGQAFNLSPKWKANFDVDYHWGLTDALDGFVGATVVYQSSETQTIGASTGQIVGGFRTVDQTIPAYTTLDLRGGVETNDGRWRLTVWGRNVTNTLYVTSVGRGFDTTFRYTGMPATVGATIGFAFE